MKAIKRQFVDFFNYFRMMSRGVNNNNNRQKIGRMIFIYIVYFVLAAFILAQTCDIVNFFYGAFIGSVISMSIVTYIQPSALAIAPFSPRQRVVFNFLCTFLLGLFYAVLITIFSIILILIMALFLFLITGENLLVFEESIASGYPAYGEAYNALLGTFMYFAIYAVCYIRSKRARVISGVALLVGLEIFSLIMVNLCGRYEYSFYSFQIYSDVARNITALAHPWIPILILSLFSALAIAASVALTIRRFKSDKI